MATRMRTKRTIPGQSIKAFVAALVIATGTLNAQDVPPPGTNPVQTDEGGTELEEQKNYFADGTGENATIFQTIKWAAGKHVRWYQVLVEKHDDQFGWKPYEQTATLPEEAQATQEYIGHGIYKTTNTQLTLALHAKETGEPQKYRYTITLFNLLGQPSFTTSPMEFEVKKAFIPEIHSSSKDFVYLDTLYDGNITIRGVNLRPQTEFSLVNGILRIPLIKAETSNGYDRADLVFDAERFDVGEWTLRAENPGEFTAETPLSIKFQKPVDFTISAGYSPEFCLVGNAIKEYFEPPLFPLGANIRLELLPFKRRIGYFGFGLSGGYFRMNTETEDYTLSSHTGTIFINLVFHKPFGNKRFRLQARAGAGVAAFMNMYFDFGGGLESPQLTTWCIAATAGASISYYITTGFFVEAGADWQQIFAKDMPTGLVVPSVSVGYQF